MGASQLFLTRDRALNWRGLHKLWPLIVTISGLTHFPAFSGPGGGCTWPEESFLQKAPVTTKGRVGGQKPFCTSSFVKGENKKPTL